ncbi:hypothetical protein ABTE06_21380, partial [Acinetobacter baumannii]
ILVITTWLNQSLTRQPQQEAMVAGRVADRAADLYRDEGELIGALGMRQATFLRWRGAREKMATASLSGNDRGATFTVFSRTFRLFL